MASEDVSTFVKLYRLAVKNVPILKYSWLLVATICILGLTGYFKLNNSDVFSYAFVVLVIIFLCIVLSSVTNKRDKVIKLAIYFVVFSIVITVMIGILGFGCFIIFQKPVFYARWFPNMNEKNSTIIESDSINTEPTLSKEKIDNKYLKKYSRKRNDKEQKFEPKQNSVSLAKTNDSTNVLTDSKSNYISDQTKGMVRFNYSDNNGKFTIGKGQYMFETLWSKASNTQIHAYKDASSIKTVALVTDRKEIREIASGSLYDASSRVRTPQLNEIVIWQNISGYFAATKIVSIKDRTRGDTTDELVFEYVINTEKTDNFMK